MNISVIGLTAVALLAVIRIIFMFISLSRRKGKKLPPTFLFGEFSHMIARKVNGRE
jgi:hypothetical protein